MVGTIGETLVDKVTPGARDVACHLAVTSATGLQSELDTLLRS